MEQSFKARDIIEAISRNVGQAKLAKMLQTLEDEYQDTTTLTTCKALTNVVDGNLVLVRELGLYYFKGNSETAGNDTTVIKLTVTTGAGRLHLIGDLAACTTLAAQALASKTAAETAETNAETAETNAETAETNAAASAAAAAASAAAAATAETNAETAETNAGTSKDTAVAAATAASTSAGTATTAKDLAQSAKTSAETAETNAETAETNAETAQAAAEAAQAAAAASAAAAAVSETAAGTSATNAATAETNAETAETNAETAETAAEAAQAAAEAAQAAAAASAAAAAVSETAAGTSATNAATAETNAETAETNAETAETNAETAQAAAEAAQAAAEAWFKNVVCDAMLVATGGVGGSPAGTLALQLQDLDAAPFASAKVFKILASAQYVGEGGLNANVTFGAATEGSILASGTGWAQIKTNATGGFACTITNAVDETVYFAASAPDGGVDALASAALLRGCVADSATWSA